MHVVDEHPTRVIGFLPEVRPVNLTVGERVLVWRQNEPAVWSFGSRRLAVTAVVDSISPDIEALPTRINPLQVQVQGGQPLRGRRIILRLEGQHDFSPGETMEIHEIHAGWLVWLDRLVLVFTRHASP